MNFTYTAILALLIAYFLTPACRKLALKFKILDMPGQRKIHRMPTPLLGGIAIYIAVITSLALNFNSLVYFSGLIIGATIIMVMGLIDDIRNLSAQLRLGIQLIAVLIVICFDVRLTFLPDNLWGNAGEVVLTIIWILGITNAMNYLDGIDGLAAGTAIVGSFFFSIISYQNNQPAISLLSVALMMACLGFLPHNLKEQKIFLGDAGSMFIGFILASIAVKGNWAEDNVVKLVVPVLILAVPIFDMVFTTVMRVKEEKVTTIIEWLKYGGKDHFHHRLLHLGIVPDKAALFICLVGMSFGINAVMVSNEKIFVGLLAIMQAAIIFASIAVLMVIERRSHHK